MGNDALKPIESIDQLVRQVEQAMSEGDFERALGRISELMLRAISVSSRRQTLCFGAAELDNLCTRVGEEMYLKLGDASRPRQSATPGPGRGSLDLYIASNLYDTGGHTPLIGDFIRASLGRRALLLVTNIDNTHSKLAASILEYMGLLDSQVALCTETTLLKKFEWLKGMILKLAPDRIFLFNHPHDSVASAACATLARSNVYFVHHFDRAPCLGAFLKSASHIDVTPFCYYCCRDKAGIAGNIFIPLVAKDEGRRSLEKGRLRGRGLITAAAGSEAKFRLRYVPNYISVVAKLLRVENRRHIHIGGLSEPFLKEFRSALREAGVSEERLTYVPHVRSLWRAMADFDVDLYIGSFPTRGARASVEVMGSGTPALWHVSSAETWFHDTHMKYPEAATWHTTAELLGIVENINDDWLRAQSQAARRQYETHHHPELIVEHLSAMPVSARIMQGDTPIFDMPALKPFNEIISIGAIEQLRSRLGAICKRHAWRISKPLRDFRRRLIGTD
jgi:hypothetical protein